ncbi:hypothetical protein KFL_001900200 [Klebsormidium nitens]|uniref:GDSL esterase/lipase n=1 Tax=Klebsormidium nitens TaxID=105231 RepID=A0A1Y1I6X7_KLENI|nr:hypothetical protein KFL_001900200 [Klebsormidium nitens]|eukprot:GAQ84477.1 hypothetical protein KFL_001900200 [Klebsormidium nitens]
MPALFVFGDSFVDTGNVPYLTKQGAPFPYGTSPRNEYVVSGRFSNGLILPDYLSQMLGLSALSHPFLEPNASWYYGCNFAFSGSGALQAGTNPGPLPEQTTAFKDFVGNATLYWRNVQQSGFSSELSVVPRYPRPEFFAGGLYLIVIGANDVLPIRGNMSIVNDVAASLQSTLQTIYNLGGRNFVVASPIDFGCIPFAINGNKGFCTNWEEAISSALGEAYRSLLASLQTKLSGATFLYLDLYNLTRTNSSNAQPLGFPEPHRACCGAGGPANIDAQCGTPLATSCIDPGRHVYWDNIHFSTDFASALAREIFAGNTYIRPKNVMQAFVLPQLEATFASLEGRI